MAYWYVNGLRAQVGGANYTIPSLRTDAALQVTFRSTVTGPITGDLLVSIAPPEAVSAGAQWRIVSPVIGNYQMPNAPFQSLGPGRYQINFKSVSGYLTPPDQTVDVAAGGTVSSAGIYTRIAPITYTLTLNAIANQGYIEASPSGTGNYPAFSYSAGTVVQLTAHAQYGYRFAGWGGALSGNANPAAVTMNAARSVTADFVSGDPRLGTLTVTIQPPEAASAGVKWGWNESDFRDSGTSDTAHPERYFVLLHPATGWSGVGSWVTIVAAETTHLTLVASSTSGGTVGTDLSTYYTLAGLAGESGSVDGVGGAARFGHPWGIATDSVGNAYVCDRVSSTIRKLTPTGAVSTFAGIPGSPGHADGPTSLSRFSSPTGIAVDSAGNVYVAETANHTIRKIDRTGSVSTVAGLAGISGSVDGSGSNARFNVPSGLAVDSDGYLYVADTLNNTIRKITPGGRVSTLAGSAGTFGSTDAPATAARFSSPSGVAVDSAGNVYVADTLNCTVRKITSDGAVMRLAGFPKSAGDANGAGDAARFSYPNGLAVDRAGNIYVADSGNHTIRMVTPAGVVSTLAGLSGSSGSTDGTGETARFRGPNGIAVDAAGSIVISDSQNRTVRATRAPLSKVEQSITFDPLSDKLISDVPFVVSGTASSGLTVTFSVVAGPATISGNRITITGPGVVIVRASQSGNATFSAAPYKDRSFTVAKLPQFITFDALSRQAFGDAPFGLAATASSRLPVSFSVLAGPVILSGNLLTMTGAGLAVLRASQAGDATYEPAPNVDQVLIVAPGNNVISDFERLANGMFTLRFYGETGTDFVLKASTNLVDWLPLATNQVNGLGYLEFTGISSTNYQRRFYLIAR